MIGSVISLISTITPLFGYVLYHIFALAFLATVPVIIMYLIRR